MNAKKAKLLRAQARATTIGLPAVAYKDHTWPMNHADPKPSTDRITRTVDPRSTRGCYRTLKKMENTK